MYTYFRQKKIIVILDIYYKKKTPTKSTSSIAGRGSNRVSKSLDY